MTAKEGKAKGHWAPRETIPGGGWVLAGGRTPRAPAGAGPAPREPRAEAPSSRALPPRAPAPAPSGTAGGSLPWGYVCVRVCVFFCAQEGQTLIRQPRAAFGAFLPSWTAFPRRNTRSPASRKWGRNNSRPETVSTQQQKPTLLLLLLRLIL